jgi:hypothetical protein
LARWCGIADANEPMSAEAFAERFDKRRMPREPITFTMDDDAWLMQR